MDFDIAVVIPVFNESQGIQRTLSRFSSNADDHVLLIVIDNRSNDQTLAFINDWHRKNRKQSLIILSEKTRGSLYARKRGLDFAKTCASVAISTDADCWPLAGFYKNIRSHFSNDSTMDVLVGRERQESRTRLLKQLYIPHLMNLISWQEHIETTLFGPLFFGGYFGIKTDKINDLVFSAQKIPIRQEPSVFWSRHCHYLGYTFTQSKPDIRTSSRRFWSDPHGSYKHSKAIRANLPNRNEQKRILVTLRKNENNLIMLRQKHFAYRLLMFVLDALFFEKEIVNKTIVSDVLTVSCNFLKLDPLTIKGLTSMGFTEAKKRIIRNSNHVLKIIEREQKRNGVI